MSKKIDIESEHRRERFIRAEQRSGGRKRLIGFGITALLFVLVGAGAAFNSNGTKADVPKNIEMIDIEAGSKNNSVTIPVIDLEKSILVRFEYQGNEEIVPLFAYVGPSGKVVAGISYCEPCKSSHFHIDGNDLVCNACGTTWELETHEGISGGCVDYPPQILTSTIDGNELLINKDLIANWKSRV